jgi:nucleotide-binding universal stress UspA family protein
VDAGGPLLICYDGSEGARAALDEAARLFAGREAVVACFWQPFAYSSKRFALNILELVQNAASVNEREEELARQIAAEGAALASAAGLVAEGCALGIDGPVDEAILTRADELDAGAIVLGVRSRSSLRSLLLGDVANEVVQRATCPVFLVPTRGLALRRRDELTREAIQPETPTPP